MKKEDLMQAMTDIDENYLTEADQARKHAQANAKKKAVPFRRAKRWIAVAAAAIALSIILPNTSAGTAYAMSQIPVVGVYFRAVTFRSWDYTDEHHDAHVDVSGVEAGTGASADVQENAENSARLTNEQLAEKTDELVAEFKESMETEGNTSLDVQTEVVTDSDQYYVVKLTAFRAAADGYEQNWYYVLSRETGELLQLKDMFQPESDYVGVISDYLKTTMKDEMANDSGKQYFVDSDMPENDFQEIAEDQQFYVNSDGQLVICFNEGDVAPMYMGALEFVIPDDVIQDIRK